MCEVILNGFIDKLIKSLKAQINHQPDKVGEIHFGPIPIFFNAPGGRRIINAVGATITIIRQSFPNASFSGILDNTETNPESVASAILTIAKNLTVSLGFLNGAPDSNFLFGSKKVYFMPFNAVLALFLDNLAGKKSSMPKVNFETHINTALTKIRQISELLCVPECSTQH